MSSIRYKNNSLFVEKIPVRGLVSKYNSPFYLYSNNNIINNYCFDNLLWILLNNVE